ncbi:endonuclease-reverse transcriptase [Trichonephila clavipes]|nr:endonuclease-reverse transcriptase [Trichonephila clavipes]
MFYEKESGSLNASSDFSWGNAENGKSFSGGVVLLGGPAPFDPWTGGCGSPVAVCSLRDRFSYLLKFGKKPSWTLNLETIRTLETFERKALRTIFGPINDQGCWRTRYNFELYRLYKELQVTQVIRSNRLRWLGHIWRSPPENNQTIAYNFKNPMGSRTRGRPPPRWI